MEDGVLFYAEQHSRRLWSSLVKFAMKWRYFSFESLGKRFLIVSLDSFNLNRQVIWRRCNRNWCFSWIHIRCSTVWILPSQCITLHWDFDSVPSKIDASPEYLISLLFLFFFFALRYPPLTPISQYVPQFLYPLPVMSSWNCYEPWTHLVVSCFRTFSSVTARLTTRRKSVASTACTPSTTSLSEKHCKYTDYCPVQWPFKLLQWTGDEWKCSFTLFRFDQPAINSRFVSPNHVFTDSINTCT